MISTMAHFEHGTPEIRVGELKIDGQGTEYRVLEVGIDLTMFYRDEQLEELFNELDIKLHLESERNEYMRTRIEELENKISDLEYELEEAQENNNTEATISDCEYDFYEAI